MAFSKDSGVNPPAPNEPNIFFFPRAIIISVDAIRKHSQIDAEKIGLVGHSEGGWTVNYAAAQDPDILFFISLEGPTII